MNSMVSISLMVRFGFGHLNFLLDASPASFDNDAFNDLHFYP